MVKVFSIFAIFCSVVLVQAQDTSYVLKQVDISKERFVQKQSLLNSEINKHTPFLTLASALSEQSGFYMKTQGLGALSTPSFRGLGAAHTPIVVDGFNMQSAMNGTFDFNLLPLFHFGDVSLSEQNRHAGAQGMSGGVALSAPKQIQNEIHYGYNQLGNHDVGGKFGFSSKKWRYNASILTQNHKNNFKINSPEIAFTQDHARVNAFSTYQKLSFTSPKIGAISTSLFTQNSKREIPNSLLSTSYAAQNDKNTLLSLRWRKLFFGKLKAETDIYTRKEQILFNQNTNVMSMNGLTPSISQTLSLNPSLTFFHKHTEIDLGLNSDFSKYSSPYLRKLATQKRIMPYLGFQILKPQTSISGQVNLNNINGIQRANGWANATFKPLNLLEYAIGISQNTRFPTLNELYWYDGITARGDTNIKAESGWRITQNVNFQGKKTKFTIHGYAGRYTNFISWIANPILSPVNNRNVSIKGVDVNMEQKIGKILQIKGRVNYVRGIQQSTSDEWISLLSKSEDPQLIFTPKWTGNIGITYSFTSFRIFVNANFIGESFISSDNFQKMSPQQYVVGGIGYKNKLGAISLNINNITNNTFYTIPNQIMPPANLEVNIVWFLTRNKNYSNKTIL